MYLFDGLVWFVSVLLRWQYRQEVCYFVDARKRFVSFTIVDDVVEVGRVVVQCTVVRSSRFFGFLSCVVVKHKMLPFDESEV